jgi:excinuclease ABC subunit C
MEIKPHINTILQTLPEGSGVYRYFDKDGTIIYVGKAKNLKKRVSSYFQKELLSSRTQMLVRNIADIQYTAVDTEFDALLLENNLIKEYLPRYNILLKDDKTYPWLCVTDEDFPRVFPTRKKLENGSRYFGPYASVKTMHLLLDTIAELFKLRRCKLFLTEKNTQSNKFKPCLNFHIHNCGGVCVGKMSKEEYNENISHIVHIIQGNTAFVMNDLREKMLRFASEMAFEKAHEIKMQIQLLEKYQAKSTIVSETISDVDVFAIDGDASAAYVCYFNVVNGAIIKTHTLSVKQQLDESYEDILLYAVVDIRRQFASKANEIIVPFPLDFDMGTVKITVPKQGDKHKLLQLAYKNAMEYKHNMQKQKELSNPEMHRNALLETMQKDLSLPTKPAHIECFDNSNIQGKFPVSSMVCFRNGKPSTKEYRIFNVRNLDTPDDFSTMEEVITRRYTRLQADGAPLPDLIIVDGGKGQVSAAYSILKQLNLEEKIPLLGIAKRLEEIYRPNAPIPRYVDKKSETQRVIQHIRDEAHRFAISHHRKRRDKALMQTELTNIQGIGEATAAKLLSVFRSVSVIKNAKMEDLEKVVGVARAQGIFNFYHA